MRITVSGLGMLRRHMPSKESVIEIESPATVRDLIEKLKDCWGNNFYEYVMEEDRLAPFIIALLNGLSINMKNGLDTGLTEGDRLVFAIMVNGG